MASASPLPINSTAFLILNPCCNPSFGKIAPDFPAMQKFLDYWRANLDGCCVPSAIRISA
ncbi:Usg protein, probable subunit of phosphoribosylanthranilate isomerase [Rhizobium sp. 57MFTsu3.2]|nr:Usg protein, probable subunit of phosphoribosylanthranilate isomerase [Rhizobium sp. 57MFTsu3.2]